MTESTNTICPLNDSLAPWQFRLTREADGAGREFSGYKLQTGPNLPAYELHDKLGNCIGVILGFPLDIEQRSILESSIAAPEAATFEEMVCLLLRRLGGRFLLIVDLPGFVRIYPDASAQVTCVIDRETGDIGSTAHALLDDAEYESRFRQDLFDKLGVEGEGWFPAGLTAHRGIERLLPDHMLNLETGRIERFWPNTPSQTRDRGSSDVSAIVANVIDEVQAQLEALLSGPKRVALALTAGHETRMLLACARPFVNDIDLVTVVSPDRNDVDTLMARRITTAMGLHHIELSRCKATEEQRKRFIRQGGHCNADANSHFHPSIWPIAETHVFFGGAGGEVARAFFWRPSDTKNTNISTKGLINRLGLADLPALQRSVSLWIENLPEDADSFRILDLAYHENRNGPWYAAQFCCDPTLVRYAPLMTYDLIGGMMALPEDWKRTNRLGLAITEAAWPELLEFPYNSLGLTRDFIANLQKVASDPRRIVKKFRRKFGK